LGNFRPKAEEISNFENVKIIFQREIFYKVKSKIALVLGPVSYKKKKGGGRDLREGSVACGERKKSSHSFEA